MAEAETATSAAPRKARAQKKPKATPRVRRPSATNGELTPMRIARGLSAYLEECRRLGLARGPGQKPLLQRKTETIEKSIVKHKTRLADATSPLVELTERSLLIELRAVLAERGEGGPSEAQQFFVQHAGAWATAKGISYYAFREMGVPAAVLKEAGIKA